LLCSAGEKNEVLDQPVFIMLRKCMIIVVIVSLWPPKVVARPVSYPGGWTLIERTDRQLTSLLVHYTLTPNWSLGARSEWDRQQDYLFSGLQATYLANRWLGENYQASVYATGGLGAASAVNSASGGTELAGFVGVLADWETRRLFSSYRIRYLEAGEVGDNFVQAVRFGWAPYEGDTGDLHSWLMIELDHRPGNDTEFGVTPVLRFFKGSARLELGWSITDDEPLINFTYRF